MKSLRVLASNIFLLLMLTTSLQSQQLQNYRAVHWTIYNGLSQGENYFMIKDANGFLWTGTKNGLNRFDGNQVKNYYHDPHNPHSIISNFILGFAEDSLHNIWIGTGRGLSRLDLKADTFTNFSLAKTPDPNHDAIPFWVTRDKLYAQESTSIVVYDVHSLKKKTLALLSDSDGYSFGPSPQYSVYDERTQSIWILRGVLNGPGGGLMKISLKDGKKKYYTWPCYRHIPNHEHNSEAMRFDSKRNALWINSRDGLVEFTLVDERFHPVDVLRHVISSKDYDRFVGIDIDRQGRIWFATQPEGLLIYDPFSHSLSSPFPKASALQKEVSDANSIIYCDKGGMVWIGTWLRTGIYQLIPYSPAVKLFTPNPKAPLGFGDNMAILFHNMGAGKLWVGTTGSIYQFDKRNARLTALDRKEFPGYKATEPVVPVLVDTNLRKAWMSNAGACFEMNLDSRQSVPVTFEDSAGKQFRVEQQNFLPFKDGWVITGIINNRKYIFTGNKNKPVARIGGQVPINAGLDFGMVTDGERLLFLKRDEAEGNLTYRYNQGRWLRTPNKTDSLQWTSIFFNTKDQSYWVAGENKLLHFNERFRLIRSYGKADGLPDLVVVGLIADNKGNIWFHTDRSIHQLNVATGEISTLTEKDGFEQQNFALYDLDFKDGNGDIYLGGGLFGSGFNIIKPDQYTNPPSSIYLQSLEVNEKPFPLNTGINDLKTLSLRYAQNHITIATGIIDYYAKGTSHMRYKLEQEGKSENWQYGPANYVIRFEDLQPGKYMLHMQASNAALQFSGPEKTLAIAISSPWYRTWWARLIVVVLAASIVIRIFSARVKKIKNDAIIQNQLRELEMKALKAQMNPHFIYNSLNSIQALVASDKKEEGIRYIGSFSRLLRSVLDNSENNVISLEKELETVDLYIQLESLRLDMQLLYQKAIAETLVTEFEKIPPLILQPFVENALWHGLSRKEGEKRIQVTVRLHEDWLICEVSDNGIGREQAREAKKNSIAISQSKGIDITRRRLLDFNDDNAVSPIEFFDLQDVAGNPLGTRVVIHIKRKTIGYQPDILNGKSLSRA